MTARHVSALLATGCSSMRMIILEYRYSGGSHAYLTTRWTSIGRWWLAWVSGARWWVLGSSKAANTTTATSALSREMPNKGTPETAETHIEKRLKRLWVRIGQTLKWLRWTNIGLWWLLWVNGTRWWVLVEQGRQCGMFGRI